MIMHCLTRAMEASAIAFAIFAIAGCGGHGAAENAGAANLAAAPSGAASGETALLAQESVATTSVADTLPTLLPTFAEQRHFNAYKSFRAMLDATSDAHSSCRRVAADTPGVPDYFECSSNSLIKLDD